MTFNTSSSGSHTELISADKVEGTKVYSTSGEDLGRVKDVMLHKRSGEVACALISFGGVLGVGSKMHPIPWSVLKYDTSKGGYVVPYDKDMLEQAPSFDEDEIYADDTKWRDRVYGYYNTGGYWS
jgi:sporulation protein YlmC with PRC-barrel domain